MNILKNAARIAIVAIALVIVGITFLLIFVFSKINRVFSDTVTPIVNVVQDGFDFSDYIKFDDNGIEIGGKKVDFSKIGEKVAEGIESVKIEVSDKMSGSLTAVDVTEAGFTQNRYSFSADINRALQIDVQHCDVIVVSGDNETITVDVFESDDYKYKFSTSDNTLLIQNENSAGTGKVINILGFEFSFGSKPKTATYTGLAMIVYLPKSFSGEIKLTTSHGDVKLGNLSLDETLRVSTSNGDIELTNLDAYEAVLSTIDGRITLDSVSASDITAMTSNGRVTMNNLTAKRYDIATSNASIEFTRLFGEKFTFVTTNGDIEGSIYGQESLFSIKTETNGSAYPKSAENDRAQYKLNASTSNSDINIRFID